MTIAIEVDCFCQYCYQMISPVLGGVDVDICFLFTPHMFLLDDTAKALSSKIIFLCKGLQYTSNTQARSCLNKFRNITFFSGQKWHQRWDQYKMRMNPNWGIGNPFHSSTPAQGIRIKVPHFQKMRCNLLTSPLLKCWSFSSVISFQTRSLTFDFLKMFC